MTAGDHFRIEVKGVIQGQAVNNHFDYLVNAGTVVTSETLTAFRALWRADVLTELGEDYETLEYSIKKLAGIAPEYLLGGPANYPPGSAIAERQAPRWMEAFALAGAGGVDTGTISQAVSPGLPSYAAVNFKKSCGSFEEPDNITLLPLEKKPRGSFRLGGIVEQDTEVAAPNSLTAGAIVSVAAIATALRTFVSASADYTMIVLSFVKDKYYRYDRQVVGDETRWYGTYAVAVVTALTASPFISTQVTRKQLASGLG